jgi:IS4 transposase
MSWNQVFEQFVKDSPVTVLMRGILEYALPPARIDELFRQHARTQYEDQLLFSTVINVLSLPVAGMSKSVNASYGRLKEKVQVSVTSLYNKLKGTELAVSQALVRNVAERLAPVVRDLKTARRQPIRGLRLKILDGNHLSGTEHRLSETRRLNSKPLPGQALVVLDWEWMLASDVFPCEDAYTQERALLDQVLARVEPNDLYVADRNFCTTQFLFGLERAKAFFAIRQHASTLHGKELLGRPRRVGRCETGTVYEQALRLVDPDSGQELVVRRVTIRLNQPMRDGETEVHLLTNVPARRAGAMKIANIYRGRWTIENAFQELGQAFASEINTLCYPKAALLCFCVALVLYNTLSALKAAIRAAHDDEAADQLSGYYLAEEIGAIYSGMMIAVPPRVWTKTFGQLSSRSLAFTLRQIASHVNPARFRKNKRGPKKPPPPRSGGIREKHVSTDRLLNQRKHIVTA